MDFWSTITVSTLYPVLFIMKKIGVAPLSTLTSPNGEIEPPAVAELVMV